MVTDHGKHAGVSLEGETQRKALHLLALVLPAGVILFGPLTVLVLVLPLAILSLLADWVRSRSQPFAKLVAVVFGSMMRSKETPGPGHPLVVNGATWTFISMTVLLLVFPAAIAVTAFVLGMVGDAFSAIGGRRFGRHNWGRLGCTIEGSIAYVVTAFVSAFLVAGAPVLSFSPYSLAWSVLLAGSAAAAVVEVLPLPGNDNVLSPFAAGLVFVVLTPLFQDTTFVLFPLFR